MIDLHRLHPNIPKPHHRPMSKKSDMTFWIVQAWVLFMIGCSVFGGFFDVSIHDHLPIEDDLYF